eukprot:6267746-Karenia_brevis.AAC.1
MRKRRAGIQETCKCKRMQPSKLDGVPINPLGKKWRRTRPPMNPIGHGAQRVWRAEAGFLLIVQ